MIDGFEMVDSTAHWVTCTLAIGLHRVSVHAQIAGRLPQGMHVPFNG
jgi:hypothetical protein